MPTRNRFLSGKVTQLTSDAFTYLEVPIRTDNNHGILIKSIEFNMDQDQMVLGWYSAGCNAIATMRARNSKPTAVGDIDDLDVIASFTTANTVATGVGQNALLTQRVWTAPSGLLVAKKSIYVCLDSYNTARSNSLRFRVNYSLTKLSDIEKLQIQAG